jgi:hypothetical protein
LAAEETVALGDSAQNGELDVIRRNLTRRLEELEARIAPDTEPLMIQIVYVSPDGSEENDGPPIEVPMPATRGRGGWQRPGRRR